MKKIIEKIINYFKRKKEMRELEQQLKEYEDDKIEIVCRFDEALCKYKSDERNKKYRKDLVFYWKELEKIDETIWSVKIKIMRLANS